MSNKPEQFKPEIADHEIGSEQVEADRFLESLEDTASSRASAPKPKVKVPESPNLPISDLPANKEKDETNLAELPYEEQLKRINDILHGKKIDPKLAVDQLSSMLERKDEDQDLGKAA